MKLSSSAFKDTQPIPDIYSIKGGNESPPLSISDVPDAAVSLAVIVHDPDAPSGDFTHWLFWNLSPDSTTIRQNELPPEAIEGQNDLGNNHWDGPAPPSGIHHYIFIAYALDILMDLPLDSSRYELDESIEDHIIKAAELVGTFSA